jgi:hypothetical protein
MTGYLLSRRVAAAGEVTSTGALLPIVGFSEAITLPQLDLYLVAEYEGDNICTKPRGPPGMAVKGFSRLKDMLTYAFDETYEEEKEDAN